MNAGPGPRYSFAIGEGYAAYRGPIGHGGPIHRHAALQVVIGPRSDVVMVDPAGNRYAAAALVIAPMAPHRILATADLVTYFVEPHCALADRLRTHCRNGITAAPKLRERCWDDIPQSARQPSRELDPRLLHAMNMLRSVDAAIPEVADSVGLSPQRLRSLARHQLGMPLIRWRAWSQVRRAVEALQTGQSPAESAVTAGFADQAHLTRQMRALIGLTPAVMSPVVAGHAL